MDKYAEDLLWPLWADTWTLCQWHQLPPLSHYSEWLQHANLVALGLCKLSFSVKLAMSWYALPFSSVLRHDNEATEHTIVVLSWGETVSWGTTDLFKSSFIKEEKIVEINPTSCHFLGQHTEGPTMEEWSWDLFSPERCIRTLFSPCPWNTASDQRITWFNT